MADNEGQTQPQANNPVPTPQTPVTPEVEVEQVQAIPAEQPKEPPVNTPFTPAQSEQPSVELPFSPPAAPQKATGIEITPTKKADPKDVEKNKLITILSYLWILFLVPLLAKHDSEFAKFHAKQGALLFTAWLVLYLVCVLIVGAINWRAQQVLIGLLDLATLVFSLLGIMHVINGNMEKLPFIGQYANKINI